MLLQCCYVKFIRDVLLVNFREWVVGPCSGSEDLAFCRYQKDFVCGSGFFYTKTPRLIEHCIIQCSGVNIGTPVIRKRDVECLMLEITEWDGLDRLEEFVVVALQFFICLCANHVHCARGKKDAKSCIWFHRLTELGEEFFQEASMFNGTFDAKHKGFDFVFVIAINDLHQVNFEQQHCQCEGIAIWHCFNLAGFQWWVKFNGKFWVNFNVIEFINQQLLKNIWFVILVCSLSR